MMSGWRIALVAASTMVIVSVAFAESPAGRLRWANGDELSGRLVSATAEKLVWQSDALSQNVTLDLSVLDSIQWPAGEQAESLDTPSQFWVVLSGGMGLHGELTAITPTHVVLQSPRHGKVMLDRRWIERLSRASPAGEIDLVRSRGKNWQSRDPRWVEKSPPLADWNVDEPDRMATSTPGARLFLETDLPEFCDIELTLESTKRPAFSLALGALTHLKKRKGNLEVETWGDILVINSPISIKQLAFEQLGLLKADTHSVSLRIFWDRRRGQVTVFSADAGLLADVPLALAPDINTGGVLLENKGADLTVTRLRISRWSAERSPRIVEGQNRIRTMNGEEFYGSLSGPNDEGEIEVTSRNEEGTDIAVPDIAEIVLHHADAELEEIGNCELIFGDGSTLRGQLIKVEENALTLQPAFSVEPITCPLDELMRCRLTQPIQRHESTGQYVLEYSGLRLRGMLAAADTGLGWRLIGADTSIPLDLDQDMTIRREKRELMKSALPAGNRDTIALKNGEQFPGDLESIVGEFATVSSNFSESTRIAQSEIHMIALNAERQRKVTGFADGGWQFGETRPEQIEQQGDKIIFHQQASVSHPTLLAGGSVEFDVDWNREAQSYLMITVTGQPVRGGVNGAGPFMAPANRTMFYLIFHDEQLMVYVMDGNAMRQVNAREVRPQKEPIHLRIQVVDDKAVLFVNDEEKGQLKVAEEREGPLGVMFQTQAVRQRNGQRGGELGMTISNLSSGDGGGLFPLMSIDKSAKEQVLTIPRMRRDRPSSHVLIGHNGDLLRGELLAVGPDSVQFRSRLDDVTIPRERLAGIVWLSESQEPPEDAADADEPPSPPDDPPAKTNAARVRATFSDGVVLQFTPLRVVDDVLLAEHPVLGECRLSMAAIDELEIGKGEDIRNAPRLTEWTLINAREPLIPNASGGFGTFSQLVGEPAEDFAVPLLEGGQFRLSEHRGKIVVLDFWATWCGPCIAAMPQLISATEAFPDEVVFVAVNQGDAKTVVQEFLEARDWDVTVGLDGTGAIGRQYQVDGIPQTVVVDREGIIQHVHLGVSNDLETSLKTLLESLLTGSPGSSVE